MKTETTTEGDKGIKGIKVSSDRRHAEEMQIFVVTTIF